MKMSPKATIAKKYLQLNIRVIIKRDDAKKNPKRLLRWFKDEMEEIGTEAIYRPESARTKIRLLLGTAKPADINLIFKNR